MLVRSGDLIPVKAEALNIPWNKRKALIFNHLYRGQVNFETLVYDTNVGDISPISSYFNPQKWTVEDLNQKFGVVTPNFQIDVSSDCETTSTVESNSRGSSPTELNENDKTSTTTSSSDISKDKSILPKLIIIPCDEDKEPFPANFDFKVPPPNFTPMPIQPQHHLATSQACDTEVKTFVDNLTKGIEVGKPEPVKQQEPDAQYGLVDFSHLLSYSGLFIQNCNERRHLVPMNLMNLCHPLGEQSMVQAVFGNDNNVASHTTGGVDDTHLSGTTVTNSSSFAFDMSLESYLPEQLTDYINNGSYSDMGFMVLETTV